jgi:hypothetical protein
MVYFALILIFNFAASEKCSKVVILPSKYYNSEGVFDANKDVDQTSDDKETVFLENSNFSKLKINSQI